MADAVSIIIAITGLIVTVYMCMKSIKTINTPCFKISVDGDLQDANLLKFVSHHITPRKVKDIKDGEKIANDIDIESKAFESVAQIVEEATSSTKKNDQ